MDTLLKNRDHATGHDSRPITITGARATIQRLLIRLSVRKGAFSPQPNLGSELHKLPLTGGEHRDRLALHYAQQALLPEGALVEEARCSPAAGAPDTLALSLSVRVGGQSIPLEVKV